MTARYKYFATRLAFVVIVLLATLTNLQFSADTADLAHRLSRAFAPGLHWSDAVDGLRNLALFAGLGVVWVVTSPAGKVRRDVWQATFTGCLLSLMVEGMQLFSPVRNASIIDVTTNTLGALLGAIAIAFLLVLLKRQRHHKSYVGLPALFIAGPYLTALLCEALTPLFKSEGIFGASGSPLARWRASMAVFSLLSWSWGSLFDLPLYFAGGFLLALLVREHARDQPHEHLQHSRVAPQQALFAAACVTAMAHLVHGTFGLEVQPMALLLDIVSLGLGVRAAERWLPGISQRLRGATRARGALGAYGLLLLIWGWRPLNFQFDAAGIATRVHRDQFIPLRSLAVRSDVFSAMHVAQQFLLYVPLGALLAVWPLRLRGVRSYLWPAIALAILIEIGHIVIAERMFDVTNALLAMAGLEIGWVVARRCGYSPYGEALAQTRT